jgi:hypothetical protein
METQTIVSEFLGYLNVSALKIVFFLSQKIGKNQENDYLIFVGYFILKAVANMVQFVICSS